MDAEAILPHALFGLLLLSRVGDVVSTRLATPTLALEANPIVRRLGWRFALVTLLVPFIAYVNTAFAVMVLVPSLLVTASNLSKVWLLRAAGEQAYRQFLLAQARKYPLGAALGFTSASSATIVLAGATLCVLEGSPRLWGYWFGLGIAAYGLAIGVHGTAFVIRLFREARELSPAATEGAPGEGTADE